MPGNFLIFQSNDDELWNITGVKLGGGGGGTMPMIPMLHTYTQSCHGKMKNRFFVKPSWILAFVSQPALALSNYHTMERMMPAAVISSGVK